MILSHRIQMTISLGTGIDEVQVQNALPLYVLLAKPVSDIIVSEHSAVYQLRRTRILKAFSEFGTGEAAITSSESDLLKDQFDLASFPCGVTSLDAFLIKFFPVVYRKTKDPGLDSNYCKYDNHGLQLFTPSLYLAGLTSTFFASYTTRNLGRRLTMLIAGIFFIIGVLLNAAAQNLAMLIIGRIFLGCGVGFANQVQLHSIRSLVVQLI